MNELKGKIKKKYMIFIAAIICGIILLQLSPAVKAETGSEPTIYDSTYIDKLETQIKGLIQSSDADQQKKLEETQKKLEAAQTELAVLKESIVFKIIKLPAGKTLIGDASTEIIVRNTNKAKAYVAATATGGISNLISGKDIPNGTIIPANQLLLVPKADGRGITAIQDTDIMIKGTYSLK